MKGESGPALSHGCYSGLVLAPRAEEIAGDLRGLVPVFDPVDEYMVGLAALSLARAERGALTLAEADGSGGSPPEKLEANVRGWTGTARRCLADLAGSPRSRAELARDLGLTAGQEVARRQLLEHIAARYGDGGEVRS